MLTNDEYIFEQQIIEKYNKKLKESSDKSQEKSDEKGKLFNTHTPWQDIQNFAAKDKNLSLIELKSYIQSNGTMSLHDNILNLILDKSSLNLSSELGISRSTIKLELAKLLANNLTYRKDLVLAIKFLKHIKGSQFTDCEKCGTTNDMFWTVCKKCRYTK